MYELFTDSARIAMNAAHDEARQLGAAWIGTEHVLLAFLRDASTVAGGIVRAHGLAHDAIRADIAARAQSFAFESRCASRIPPGRARPGRLPETDRLIFAIGTANCRARTLPVQEVGTADLLLAVLSQADNMASIVLRSLEAPLHEICAALETAAGDS